MIRYFVHRGGRTELVDRLDSSFAKASTSAKATADGSEDKPAGAAGDGVVVWADVSEPTDVDAAVLRNDFGLHPLAVEAAVQRETSPKVETYGKYLYVVLHGINFDAVEHRFETHETDFFLASNFLVTVHDGKRRSIEHVSELCGRTDHVLAEGPVALFHRILDTMVDHYRPEVDEVEGRLNDIEDRVIEDTASATVGDILAIKRDITALRRILVPQRDAVGRLARREFEIINQEMAYRFRDVYDQFARMADDGIMFHDRVTGILDAHLASVSNRLADVSKVLAVIATLFGPMTVITGLFGMNVPLPTLLGQPEHQFWEIIGMMVLMSGGLFLWFRKSGWW